MNEKSCVTCLYEDGDRGCSAERCDLDMNGWRPKDTVIGDARPLALHKEPDFSLDKLIDDHWKYVEGILKFHGEDDEVVHRCKYHYKTAAAHFWKHCCEHYGIKEEK